MGGLVEILIALIIVGAIIYVLSLLPINQTIKQIATVIVVVFVAIWLLRYLGNMSGSAFWR